MLSDANMAAPEGSCFFFSEQGHLSPAHSLEGNGEANNENGVGQRLVVAGGKTCKCFLLIHEGLICCSVKLFSFLYLY